MARDSQAKKARRKKRRATRESAWLPAPVFDRIRTDEDRLDAIDAALADIDDWIAPRGWVVDDMDADDAGLVSWYFPPSAAHFDDPDLEPVTRMWIRLAEDPDEVVLEFGAILVGFGADDIPYVLDADTLPDDIAALESYRPGLPRPVL